MLEHCIRDELNTNAQRRVAVLRPIKVVITNYPEDKEEYFELPNIPKNDEAGVRKVPFTRELYIDADDFAEVPPPKFFRMKPDGEVRLMGAYIVNATRSSRTAKATSLNCIAPLTWKPETATLLMVERSKEPSIGYLQNMLSMQPFVCTTTCSLWKM